MADKKQEFIDVHKGLRKEIMDLLASRGMPEETVNYVGEMVEYNSVGGKLNRGMSVLDCTKELAGVDTLSPQLKKQASILGWCIEWLQACFLVSDDIMDGSITRRGQPCWYRKPNVQLTAVNDSLLLENFIFQALRKHFREHACYVPLVEVFHDVCLHTEMGQLLDLTSQPRDAPVDLSRFTADRHRKIVVHKTAFYTFYLPAACAMYLRNITDESLHESVKQLSAKIGEYFQVQDDYLDCYGDAKVLGKVGTDIQENKCSWLVIQALARASDEQRALLDKHYGSKDEESIAIIKKIYDDMNLKSIYQEYEEKTYKELCDEINQFEKLPSGFFMALVNKIYKRDK